MEIKKPTTRQVTLRLTMTAMFMAMTVACSTFSIPVPGGHLYLCDVPICLAAVLMDPVSAFLVGGVGSFLGDFLFYPLPMFVSLVSHGLQAIIISLCAHYTFRRRPVFASGLGVLLGGIVMIIGSCRLPSAASAVCCCAGRPVFESCFCGWKQEGSDKISPTAKKRSGSFQPFI